jgi:hypothetical protein
MFNIDMNAALTTLSAPVLAITTGGFTISTTALPTISFPELESVTRLTIVNNTEVTSLSFPVLSDTGISTTITGNTALSSCTGALIAAVGDCAP